MDESGNQSFFKDEYLLIQSQYEDYDRRALTIKGWIGSGLAAALALSFTASSRFAFVIPIFVAVIAGVFWYLETKWKMFQYAYREKILLIEAYFRGDQQKSYPFQIIILGFQLTLEWISGKLAGNPLFAACISPSFWLVFCR